MKLCWDNIENLRLTRSGNFKDITNNRTYYYHEKCKNCGEPFFGLKESSGYCCNKCIGGYDRFGANNPFYGKKHTEESLEKMRFSKKLYNPLRGIKLTEEHKRRIGESKRGKYCGENSSWYGRKHTEETKKKISETHTRPMLGKHHSEETKKLMRESHLGKNDGYAVNNLPKFDVYAPQMKWVESVRRNESDPNILEVKCTHCDKWFIPKRTKVVSRIMFINGVSGYNSEHRFYCSEECKHSCPLYRKTPETLMKQDAIRAGRLPWTEMSREVQTQLRRIVLERDDYTCVKCGSTEKLCCHHILPVAIDPLESADVDNCVTLCEECHKEVHSQPGCRYDELKMEICND